MIPNIIKRQESKRLKEKKTEINEINRQVNNSGEIKKTWKQK